MAFSTYSRKRIDMSSCTAEGRKRQPHKYMPAFMIGSDAVDYDAVARLCCSVYVQDDVETAGTNRNLFVLIGKLAFARTAFAVRRK